MNVADGSVDISMLDQAVPYPADMAGLPTSTPNPGNLRRKSRRSWFENTPKGSVRCFNRKVIFLENQRRLKVIC